MLLSRNIDLHFMTIKSNSVHTLFSRVAFFLANNSLFPAYNSEVVSFGNDDSVEEQH